MNVTKKYQDNYVTTCDTLNITISTFYIRNFTDKMEGEIKHGELIGKVTIKKLESKDPLELTKDAGIDVASKRYICSSMRIF